MSPPASDLRPLAIGEIIDRSATFWRHHLKPLFVLSLGFQLVSYILTKGIQLSMQSNLLTLQSRSASPLELIGVSLSVMAKASLLLVFTFWFHWCAAAVVSRYVVPTWLGKSVTPGEALRSVLPKLGTLTGAYALSLLWGLVITLLVLVPTFILSGISGFIIASQSGAGSRVVGVLIMALAVLLATLGSLGAILWYLMRFCLLAPALAMEDLSALEAFRRSRQLISGRVEPGFTGRVAVRATILFTVITAILLAVGLLPSLPALVVTLSYGHIFDPAATAVAQPIPQSLLVPAELIQVFGQAVFSLLVLVFYATFYLDMRVRREALDLEQRLAALETQRAVSA